VNVADRARIDANTVAATQRQDSLHALEQQKKDSAAALEAQTKSAERSNGLAERSAKAAESSAQLASQALRISERAYLSMVVTPASPPTAGEKIKVRVVISNSGRTPAFDVHVLTRGVYAPPPITGEEARRMAFAAVPQGEASVMVLPPGQSKDSPSESPSPLVQAGVDQLAAGTAKIYVWVSASYNDVFKQPHDEEVCVVYSPTYKNLADCQVGNTSN
jgi:hypothetical protein